MDFKRFKKINDERLNYREMDDADVISSYRNTGCGDGYRLYLKVDAQKGQKYILDASYTTTGCGFGLVSLAMATEWAKGKTLAQATKVSVEDIESLFTFPPRRKNYPASAVECLRKAVADYQNGTGISIEERVTRQMVLAKLKKEGHLRGAKLRQVILEGEDLRGVDFTEADLSHAFLTDCNLEGAILYKARLRGSFLNNANLKDADLSQADLRWAKLTGASVQGARFVKAVYDIGTRLDSRQTHLFAVMQKGPGADVYVRKEEETLPLQ